MRNCRLRIENGRRDARTTIGIRQLEIGNRDNVGFTPPRLRIAARPWNSKPVVDLDGRVRIIRDHSIGRRDF